MGQVKKKTKDPIPKLQAELAKVKKQLAGKSPVTLLANSVTTNTIAANAVTTGEIAANAVTSNEIAANTITASDIAASTITTNEIAANTITAGDIAANTITAGQIAAGTITATQIAAGTITATNILAGTITSTQIQAGSINSDRLYAGAVQAQLIQTNNLSAGSITANEIAANTITATQLHADAVTTVVLAADSVTSAKIAANTIIAGDIAANTITSNEIAAATITATNIAAGTITSTLLASNSVTSAAIVSGAVTSGKISVSQLSAIAADLGTITAGTVTGATLRTASSGKRVVIDTTGITGYGGSGSTVVFNFDTTPGNLTLTGVVTASAGSIVPATVIDATGGGIVSSQITNGTIVGADIAANTIAANNIVAATITATELATDSVTSVKILAATIVAGDIASGTITSTQIAAGTITASNIASGTITSTQIAAGTITATQLSATAIDAMTITGATFRTASSGDRVEISGSGATGYVKVVVSAVDVVKLDATNGLVFQAGSAAPNIISFKASGVLRGAFDMGSGSGDTYMRAYDPSAIERSKLYVSAAAANSTGWGVQSSTTGTTDFRVGKIICTTIQNSTGTIVASMAINGATYSQTLVDTSGNMSLAHHLYVQTGSIFQVVNASGDVGIRCENTNTSGYGTYVKTASTSSGQYIARFDNGNGNVFEVRAHGRPIFAASGQTECQLYNNGGQLRYVATAHLFRNNGDSGYADIYYQTAQPQSDARMKASVETVQAAVAKLRSVRGVSFEWKPGVGPLGRRLGIIAQEAQVQFPELVSTRPGDDEGLLHVNYEGFVAPLIESVRELDQRDDKIELSVQRFGELLRSFAADVSDTIGGQKGKQLAARFGDLEHLLGVLA